MGTLRIEPKVKQPGFVKLQFSGSSVSAGAEGPTTDAGSFESTIRLVTRHGTVIQLSRDVPLKQVARLVRLLDGSLRL